MKKVLLCFCIILLIISTFGCNSEDTAENIHQKIHDSFYDIASYNAKCSVTSFTTGGENTYECSIDYNKQNDSYKIISNKITIALDKKTASVTNGTNTIKTPISDDDMYIFVNTFFKNYYESESTSINVNAEKSDKLTLLECDVMNPTPNSSHMKLWINNKNILPKKMQVYDKENVLNTEIVFDKFVFKK